MKKILQSFKNPFVAIALLVISLNVNGQAPCVTIFNVSGGGARCSNGGGIGIFLSGSQTGVKYQLVRNGNLAGTPLSGTNGPLTFLVSSAGTYTILGTDASSSCSSAMNGSATVTINPAPSISYTKTDISCAGADGSITITGIGGTPGYLFNIDGGAFGASNTFTGLSGGNHVIGIQDANTCGTTTTVNIQNASPLGVTISSVNPGDCSGTNGSITAKRVGGVDDGITPVQYKLDGDVTRPYQNSNVFGGLSKGSYTITIKDSKGCTAVSSTVTLTQVAGVTPTTYNVSGGGTRCDNAGAVSILLSGSETGVSYRLSNDGTPVGSSLSGTGNPLVFIINNAGNYTVVATNTTAGCTNVMNGTATIIVNPAPTIFTVSGGGTRCGNGSGVSITLSGSQTGVKYQLVKSGTPVATPLTGTGSALNFLVSAAGTYSIRATNIATNCTNLMNGTAAVNVNPIPTAFNVQGGGTRCFEASSIAVQLSSSQTGVNYQLLNNGVPSGSPVAGTGSLLALPAVDPGTYTVAATNATTGCTNNMTGSVNVSINPELHPTYGKYFASSCVGGDGTITVHGKGGTAPYMYSVDNGPFLVDSFITGLAAGDHRVEVKDANSCSYVFEGITILTAPLMKVNTTRIQPSSCAGNDGKIVAGPYGGVVDGITPLEYKLDGTVTTPFQLSNTFDGLTAGTYTITIKDSKGCLADTTVVLQDGAPLEFAANSYSSDAGSCGDGTDGRISVTITGGQPPYHYSLDGTEIGQSINPFFAFNNVGLGTHTVTVTDIHQSCSNSRDFTIIQASTPVATVVYRGSETCLGKNNGYISLSASGNGGVPGYKYSKDGGFTYQGSPSFTDLAPGGYSMVVKDSKGCTSAPVSVTLGPGKYPCPPVNESGSPNQYVMGATDAIGAISLNSQLIIQTYPNPFASDFKLDVRGNNKEKVGIIVSDVLGRRMLEIQGNANQQYSLGKNLQRGIYFVRVIQGKDVQTIKIVKE